MLHVIENPIGAVLGKDLIMVRSTMGAAGEAKDGHAGGNRCLDAIDAVFDDQAVRRVGVHFISGK